MITKTIIIAGGAGRVGRKLIEKLVQTQFLEIIVIDNFVSSEDFDSFYNAINLIENVKLTLFDFDITHPNMVNFIKERYLHVDCIYHFGFSATRSPVKTLEVGYTGTKNILELARNYRSKMFYKTNVDITETLCLAYKTQYKMDIEKFNS